MRTIRALSAALLVATALACGRGDVRPRVIVLGMDGMDPRVVDLLMAEGGMPHFARMRQEGAYGRLRSEEPLLSPILWTTIATGKRPDAHGIGHFVAIDARTGAQTPVTSQMRRVKALWNIASDQGRRVGVVGWWATWPPEQVNGTIVSDHTCYHFLFPQPAAGASASAITYPPDFRSEIAPLVRRPDDVSAAEAARFIDVDPAELQRPFDFAHDVSHFRWALATADTYRRIGLKLWSERRPDLLLAYVEGIDSTSHLFGHLFRAERLSGELARQQTRFGMAVERMYAYADAIVGEFLEAAGPDATVIVLSDHGFDLGAPQDDPSRTRDLRRVSERFHNPEGILYLWGRGIRRARLDQPALVDVAPTVLRLSGLPLARDMPGRVLEEALRLDGAADHVASYEGAGGGRDGAVARDEPVDPAVLERLRSLGYLGAASAPGGSPASGTTWRSPRGERNLAAMLFRDGRVEEAAAAYRRLIALDPGDAALRTSLAGCLGALGRYDEAWRELGVAIRLDPLNVEAYHNRAVIHERRGNREAALADYRRAARYDPKYEPSRTALLRLTGSADVRTPRTPGEARAAALAEQAADDARRGDYASALARLREAETLAPRYTLVHQYRSNVAYLAGDLAGAIRALERGLALEPDNALFRANLARLQKQAAARR
jgi:predicted AlkP superfamily phosphohydrolase/phosphomutase/Flp pilus assembly protein TadD